MRTAIALGSNLGDRMMFLRRAREAILALPGLGGRGETVSAPIYETAPVDCPPGAGPFLNTVIELEADLPPAALLAELRAIEAALGRPARHPRNAPRSIDLDILYAGALVVRTAELTLPHPRLHQRRFVLEPLAALRPDLVLPGRVKSVAGLLRDLGDSAETRLIAREW